MINLIGRVLAVVPAAPAAAGNAAAGNNIVVLPSIGANVRLTTVVGGVISTALYIGGTVAVMYLLYGGFMYTTAGGEAEQATKARTIIINAIIGIVIIALALAVVSWANTSITSLGTGNNAGF